MPKMPGLRYTHLPPGEHRVTMAVPGRWVTRKHVESGKSGGLLQRFRRFRWKRTVPVDLNVPKKDQTPTGKPPDIFHSNFAYSWKLHRKVSNHSGYFVGKLVASHELHGSELFSYFPGDGNDYPVRAVRVSETPSETWRVGSFRTMHQKVVCWKAFLVVMVLVASFKNRF